MSGKIVIVKKEEHANLDSFPFRYGFSSPKDFNLLIHYDSKPIVQKFPSSKIYLDYLFETLNNVKEIIYSFLISY